MPTMKGLDGTTEYHTADVLWGDIGSGELTELYNCIFVSVKRHCQM